LGLFGESRLDREDTESRFDLEIPCANFEGVISNEGPSNKLESEVELSDTGGRAADMGMGVLAGVVSESGPISTDGRRARDLTTIACGGVHLPFTWAISSISA